MSESKRVIDGIEAPDAEVELSAQDLMELSAPCENNNRVLAPLEKVMTAAIVPSAPALQKRPAPAAVHRSMSGSHIAASLIFAIGVVGALYYAVVSYQDADDSMAQLPQAQSPASAAKSAGEPVRFANPFDANEVFEFPPGTSKAEARDAVAEILMERAMERQRKFDARVSSNR